MDTRRRRRALIESFEPRIMYSAGPGPAGLAAAMLTAAELRVDGGEALQGAGTELVFIDARVPELQLLLDDLAAQQQAGRAVEVVVVGADEDGVALIGEHLAGRSDVAAIHLIGHGADGVAELGAGRLDAASLVLRAGEISAWGDALSAGADLLIYGCDVASTPVGEGLVDALAALTGADVAASDDLTGATSLGGDWDLEYRSGSIERALAPGAETQEAWGSVLAISANGTVSSANNVNTNVLSWSHTVASGTDRALFVEISIGTTGTFASNVTYNDTALTLVGRSSSGTVPVEIWRLLNPSVGTSNVVVNLPASTSVAAGATTYNGVNQTSPVRSFYSASGNSTNSSVTVADSVAGDLVIDVQSWAGQPTGGSVGPGQTLNWSQANTSITGTSTREAGAPSVVMSGSFTSSAQWVIGAVAIRPSAGITVTPISGLTVTEAGGTAQFSVVLDTAPTSNVTIGLTSSDTTEGTLSASSLTFTSANWNVAQTVTVTGVNDSFVDGNVAFSIVTAAASSIDANYNGRNASDVSLTNTDDDTFNTLVVDTASDGLDGTTTSIAALMANKGSDGKISLREAITAANNTANGPGGADRISFAIGTGTQTISLASALPVISGPLIIDGRTQTGYGGTPLIVIDANGLAANGIQLGAAADGSTVRGLVLSDFTGNAIQIDAGSDGNTIAGNYIGSFGAGGLNLGGAETNLGAGVWVAGAGNIIGGVVAEDRNVIGGNANGVIVNGAAASNNTIAGNYIGTDATGNAVAANTFDGVRIEAGATANTVGGATSAHRNVISGNGWEGVQVDGEASDNNIIRGNWVGVNAAGTAALGNGGEGIFISGGADGTYVGGSTALEGNWIAGSGLVGIQVDGATVGMNIRYNRIGTDAAGTANWGTQQDGILLENSGGGAGPTNVYITYNTVAFSGQGGVYTSGITLNASAGASNSINGNSIYSNVGLGIDLGPTGVTANDAGDADTGANQLQNYPVLTLARTDGSSTLTVAGSLNSSASTSFLIEVFASPSLDASGYGEGKTSLGSFVVTTDGSGNASFTQALAAVLAQGQYITATASRYSGGFTFETSEFSRGAYAISSTQASVVVDTVSDASDGDTTSLSTLLANKGSDGLVSLREAITAANNTANGAGGADRISFNIATALVGGTHTITPTTSLPTITDAVVIDGTSEPDYVVGRPVIEIDGSLTGSGVHGLVLAPGSGGSTIRGLAINGFNSNDGFGLYLQAGSDNNLIAGNVIGLDADGTTAVAVMNNFGIYVASSGNLIGGTTEAARNVLSNNINAGVGLWGSSNVVIGNYIGTDATGTLDRGNAADGVDVFGGSNNRIGGVTVAERNIISGNDRNGIEIAYNVPGTLVQGNYIGTDAGGTLSLGNSLGGIWVGGGATGVTIGGTAAGAGNRIVNNPVGGLYTDTSSVSFTLLGNTFDSNSYLAVDLRGDGVTANDAGDADTGPNNLQNYPEIGSVVSTGGNTTVTGTLRSNASTTYRLEFFSSPSGDASGYGEGQTWLGATSVTTDAAGNATFSATFSGIVVSAGYVVSATATVDLGGGSYGATSEFAANRAVNTDARFTAAQDTYVSGNSPTLNYGASGSLVVDYSGASIGDIRALLQFDLSSLPSSATIASATLQMMATGITGAATNINVYQLTESWVEGSGNGTAGAANWTERQPGTAWSTAGGSFNATVVASLSPSATGLHSWDLTALVRSWVSGATTNNGLVIGSPDSSGQVITYDSSEGTTPPVLVISYSFAANNAPVLDAARSPALGTMAEDAGAPVGAVGTLVSSLVDFASPAGQVDNVTDADAGALLGIAVVGTNTGGGSWWYSTNNGGNWLAMGSVSEASARLLSADAGTRLYFQPNPDWSGSLADAITFRAWDRSNGANGGLADATATGGSTAFSSASDTVSLTVTAVNDAPVVTTSGGSATYTENAGVVVDGGLTVVDADGGNLAGATVAITGGFASGQDRLGFTDQNGIRGSWNGLTGVLSLSGSASVADYQAALRSITYSNASDSPTTASRTVSFTVSDGTASSNTATRGVSIASINDAPTFDAAEFYATLDVAGAAERGQAVVVQPDGKILVAGYTGSQGSFDFLLVRYNADGSMDTSFGGGDGIVTTAISAGDDKAHGLALQADGKIIVVGKTSGNGGDFAVLRYNADGSLDSSFGGGDGIVTTDFAGGSFDVAYRVVVQADGRIVVGGASGSGTTDFAVARYLADGSLDNSFSGDGKQTVDLAGSVDEGLGLALDATGRIIQVGAAAVGGQQDFGVVRYNTDGSLDTSFSGDGKLTTAIGTSWDIAHQVAVQAGGKIVVGGYSGASNNDLSLIRLNDDGTPDGGFGTAGVVTTNLGGNESLWDLALQPDGRIVVVGGGGDNHLLVARYLADGSADTSFSGDGNLVLSRSSFEILYAVDIAPDGRIVAAGYGSNATEDLAVLRLSADGALDTRLATGSSSLGGAVSYTENGLPVVIDSSVRVFDAELSAADSFDGATLILARSGGASSQDVFSATGNLAALTGGQGLVLGGVTVGTVVANAGGTLSLSFNASATQARINEVLSSIAYANSSDAPPASVQLDWAFSDGNSGGQGSGGALAASGSSTVNITALNDAPVITFVAGSVNYPENAGAAIVAPFATVSDVDSTNFDGGRLVMYFSANGQPEDRIAISNLGTGAGQIGVSGNTVTYGGVVIGSWAGGTDGATELIVSFNANATAESVQALGRRITYENVSDNPSTLVRTMVGYLEDGDGGTSNTVGGTLTILPANDAPVVTIAPASYAATEQVVLTLSGTGMSASDADAGTAVLHATLSVVSGTLTGSAGSTGVTLAGSGTSSVTLDGTLAQINAFLAGTGGASLSYLIATDAPPASDTFTLTVNDLGYTGGPAQSGSDTATINITAVNDGPANHIPGVQVTPANTAVVMSAAAGNGLSITDPDAGSGLLRVALTATSGTLTLGTTAGLATVSGDGTASVLVTGTLAALNTALDGLRFTPAGGYTGTASFVVETSDQGNTGGGALTDSDTVFVKVGASRYQQGVDGYTGTEDTYVSDGATTTIYGNATTVVTDDGAPVTQALLRFGNLFGSGVGQIPNGAVINSVALSFYVTNTDANDSISIYRMLSAWDENSTWNSLGAGVSLNGVEAASSPDVANWDSGISGWNTITSGLTASVQAWANGAVNNGWVFNAPSGAADKWTFASSEYATVSQRPYLVVSYTPPAPPVITSNGGGATAAVNVAENSTYVTTVTATDADSAQGALSYAIAGGADADKFSITASGVLSFKVAPDYEAPGDIGANRVYDLIVRVSDGYVADTQDIAVTVTAVNEAPALGGLGGSVIHTEGGAAAVLAGTATVSDPELSAANSFDGATLTLARSGGANADDIFSATGRLAALTAGQGLVLDGVVMGSITANAGGTLSLSFNANATQERVNELIQSIAYANASDAPPASVEIGWTFNDGNSGSQGAGSALGAVGSTTVNITAVNDPAVIGGTASANLTETNVAQTTGGTLTITDVDSAATFVARSGVVGSYGTFSLDTVGAWTYTMDSSHNEFIAGQTYTDSFTASSADGTSRQITVTITGTNDAPTVATPVADQSATEDSPFSFTLPAGTFTDVDAGDSLAYSVTGLPSWLSFDAATRTFTGTPTNADVGVAAITVTATDGSGASASDSFVLAVNNTNDAPTVATPVADQSATEDSPFSFTLPAGTFTDVDAGDSLAYSVTGLPSWLSFDAATRTFTGTPTNADVGVAAITVTATDGSGASASDSFTLTVANTNDAPTVASAIADQSATEDSAFSFTLPAGTFTDVDAGDNLSYTTSTLPNWLSFDAATRSFTGTPTNADVGSAAITVTATDGSGATASDSFTLTVANTNDAPTVASEIADQSATEESAFSFTLPAGTFTDVDAGDSLTYTTSTLPSWLSFDAATRSFTGTPTNVDVGSTTITVTAADGSGATASDSFVLTVNNTNDAPTLATPVADQSATEDSAFSFTFPANTFTDVDAGDSLAYSATGLPSWLVFDAATRSFTGTPTNADVGSAAITITATDGSGASASDSFTLTVANTNDTPTLATPVADQSATEDSAFSFTFPANTFTDVDAGDNLSYTTSTLPNWLSFDAATRTFTGTPTNADVGSATITVTATDGSGATASDSFTLTVANTNDAPTVASEIADQSATEDTPFSFTLPAGTFTDVDAGDSLTYTTSTLPSWLVFDAATRTFTGTPTNPDVGSATITVTATDNSGATASDSFTLTVLNTNDAPVAEDDSVTTAEDTPVVVDVVANDLDLDGDVLVISATRPAAHGVVSFAGGSVRYTPDADFHGSDSFSYTVSDGRGGTSMATVRVTVTPINDQPQAADDALSLAEDGTASASVATNDSPSGDGGNVWSVLDGPRHGSLVLAADGSFRYTPDADFHGTDRFTYTLTDADGDRVTATATLLVTPVNDAPVMGGGASAAFNIAENTTSVTTLTATDVDRPAQALSYSIVGGADQALFSIDAGSGELRFIAAPDHDVPTDADGNNLYELIVQVSDGTATGSQTLAITVDNRNEMPQGSDGRVGVAEDGSHRFTLADFGFRDDLDRVANNLAAVQIVALPGQGVLQLAGRGVVAGEWVAAGDISAGQLTYQPAPDANGRDYAALLFRVRDDGGTAGGGIDIEAGTHTLNIDVAAVNDAPSISRVAFELPAGTRVVLGAGAIVAADVDSALASLEYVVDAATGGHFERAGAAGQAIAAFTQAELMAGRVVFVHDAAQVTPVVVVHASDGQADSNAITATITLQLSAPGEPTAPVVTPQEPPVTTVTPVVTKPAVTKPADADKTAKAPTTVNRPGLLDGLAPAIKPASPGDGQVTLAPDGAGITDPASRMRNQAVGGTLRFERAPVRLSLGGGLDGPLLDFMLRGDGLATTSSASASLRVAESGLGERLQDKDGEVDVRVVVQAIELTGVALSVGAVWWATRAGAMVASLLMSAPAWRSFDPLMVLGPEDEEDRDWARATDDQAAQDEMGIADVFDTRTGGQP